MKKVLCLLLTMLILFSFCACGDDSTGTDKPADPRLLGKVAGNTYRNDYFGIGCTLPSDWTFKTEAEILEQNKITADVLDDASAEVLKNASIIYDMAASTAAADNMNVNMEKITAAQAEILNLKQVFEAQIPTIEAGYKSMGYTNIKVNYQKTTVDGKSYDSLVFSADYVASSEQTITLYGVAFGFVKENYIVNVSVCSTDANKLDTYLGYFTID